MENNNNINIDVGLRRSLALATAICAALACMPLFEAKHAGYWLPGAFFGFIFGFALGMIHKGLATVVILGTAIYYADMFHLFD
jgi:hypothetical protein